MPTRFSNFRRPTEVLVPGVNGMNNANLVVKLSFQKITRSGDLSNWLGTANHVVKLKTKFEFPQVSHQKNTKSIISSLWKLWLFLMIHQFWSKLINLKINKIERLITVKQTNKANMPVNGLKTNVTKASRSRCYCCCIYFSCFQNQELTVTW